MDTAGRLTVTHVDASVEAARIVRAARGEGLPADLDERVPRPETGALPAVFRLAEGVPVAEKPSGPSTPGQGQGAGGGFGVGTAWDGRGERPEHPVLIVDHLDPALASMLPGLAGLVAQTGSPLSHLAVLAREHLVPTAVGVDEAIERFPVGTLLAVDGGTGAVTETAGRATQRHRHHPFMCGIVRSSPAHPRARLAPDRCAGG
ncbi:PEP-utilizing enzyme [Streptomyces sp. NPDC057428]|uniref:PEP-utilizing enzyme n=1 Tax=Streptomyces sp. NPDC057428 TaxID=3346129 RepID=UPI003679BB5B